MPNRFHCKQLATHATTRARVCEINTPHGTFLTPTFMPVATRAAMNCMDIPQIQQTQSQIILGGNTYHMLVAPGMETLHKAGGMHPFMNWQGPMLTDSGGFQVFSLSKNSKICRIKEDGAHFKHPVSGKVITMTPAVSIKTQKTIGADIIMVFDECTPEQGGREAALAALTRTKRWLLESIDAHLAHPDSDYGNRQALFGIVQGGSYRDLREESLAFLLSQPLDGLAIGGEVIGFDMPKTREICEWLVPLMPDDKPRYTMGVGLNPQNLIDVVTCGIDMFDCVAPTRNARHGSLYHGTFVIDDGWVRFETGEDKGKLLIKKSKYAHDQQPIMQDCDCSTCKDYTRSYLHYLYKEKQSLYLSLACIHNVRVMQKACELMRELIV